VSSLDLGRQFVAAIAAQDHEALTACFADDAILRALIPPGLREREGAHEAAELVHSWFADSQPLELIDSSVEELSDRLHVRYRFHGTEDGDDFIVEQHLYGTVDGGKLARADIVCSGFRPR
jgi:ketosteroid isomerase-like protein